MDLDKILDVVVGVLLIGAIGVGAFNTLAGANVSALMSQATYTSIIGIGFIVFFIYWLKANVMKRK